MNPRTLIRTLVVLLLTTATILHAAKDQPLSLAGTWRFELDRADAGVNERWFTRALPDTIQLPGSLQERGYGDDISTNTVWTGSLNERSWFTADRYAPYRQPGNVKVPFWLQPDKSYVGVAWYQRDIDVPKSWLGPPARGPIRTRALGHNAVAGRSEDRFAGRPRHASRL